MGGTPSKTFNGIVNKATKNLEKKQTALVNEITKLEVEITKLKGRIQIAQSQGKNQTVINQNQSNYNEKLKKLTKLQTELNTFRAQVIERRASIKEIKGIGQQPNVT